MSLGRTTMNLVNYVAEMAYAMYKKSNPDATPDSFLNADTGVRAIYYGEALNKSRALLCIDSEEDIVRSSSEGAWRYAYVMTSGDLPAVLYLNDDGDIVVTLFDSKTGTPSVGQLDEKDFPLGVLWHNGEEI